MNFAHRRVEGESVVLLRLMVEHLDALGRDGVGFARSLGVPRDALAVPDARVGIRHKREMWSRFAAAGAGPLAGFELAEKTAAADIGLVGFLATKSATVEDALRRVQQFSALITRTLRYHLDREGEDALLECRVASGVPPSALRQQYSLGVPHRHLSAYAPGWVAREVTLVQVDADRRPEYEAFFGVPVTFGQSRDALRFDAAFMTLPLAHSDSSLVASLEHYAQEALSQLGADDAPFIADARAHCTRLLERNDTSLDALAKSMGQSRRSLQRRLREHGTSHRELLDDVRKSLALRLLKETDASLFEIAMLLGFSDQSAFQRAFKRWTQTTPRLIRDR